MFSNKAGTSADELLRASATGAPPVAVAGGTLLGMPIGDVVLWGTLLYIALQILVIAPKVPDAIRELFGKKDKSCSLEDTKEINKGDKDE